MSITLDDWTAALVRAAAERETKGNVSEWLARAAVHTVFDAETQALKRHDAAHPEQRAAELAEAEAARDARWSAEQARGAA
jgi:hypothetical protein